MHAHIASYRLSPLHLGILAGGGVCTDAISRSTDCRIVGCSTHSNVSTWGEVRLLCGGTIEYIICVSLAYRKQVISTGRNSQRTHPPEHGQRRLCRTLVVSELRRLL